MRSIYCVRASLRNLPATFNFDSISAVFIKHFAVLQSDSELLIIMHQTVAKTFQCSALNIMERSDGTIENKLPLIEVRPTALPSLPTLTLSVTLTCDLDFQVPRRAVVVIVIVIVIHV